MTPNGTCCPAGQKPSGNSCKPSSDNLPGGGNANSGGGVCCAPGNIPVAEAPVAIRRRSPKTAIAVRSARRPIRADDRPASSRQPPAMALSSTANAARQDERPPRDRARCVALGQKPDDKYQSTCIGPAAPACPDGSPIPASGSCPVELHSACAPGLVRQGTLCVCPNTGKPPTLKPGGGAMSFTCDVPVQQQLTPQVVPILPSCGPGQVLRDGRCFNVAPPPPITCGPNQICGRAAA